jgi:NarL family two-component system response regulator LiaR
MKRHILFLGILGGLLIALLQYSQYRFLVLQHSAEIYAAIVAIIFSALGIWLGVRLTSRRPLPEAQGAEVAAAFTPNQARRETLGITPRELEILALVAQGLSNREIAAQLFLSENTVKTHCSRAFDKLGARRRTQAVQLGKQLGLLP